VDQQFLRARLVVGQPNEEIAAALGFRAGEQ
jgi:hypothetical protein